jgi:hypothetical protein
LSQFQKTSITCSGEIISKEISMCDHDGLDWEDIGLAGALAEEMAEEQKELERMERELSQEDVNDDDV